MVSRLEVKKALRFTKRIGKANICEAAISRKRARGRLMTGAMRLLFVQDDLAPLRDQFVINLQRFSTGDIPAQLNAVYQRVMQLRLQRTKPPR